MFYKLNKNAYQDKDCSRVLFYTSHYPIYFCKIKILRVKLLIDSINFAKTNMFFISLLLSIFRLIIIKLDALFLFSSYKYRYVISACIYTMLSIDR